MGLKRTIKLFPLAAALVHAQDNATTAVGEIVDPIYAPQQCDSWINTLEASDIDSSKGLSEQEFYNFLSSIEDPPYVKVYFSSYKSFNQLPWSFRIVHKSLACHCHTLGKGEECCEGDDAEVLLFGSDTSTLFGGEVDATSIARTSPGVQYKGIFCQQIAYVIGKSVPSPAPTAAPSHGPTVAPSDSPTEFPSMSPVTPSPISPLSQAPTTSPVEPAVVEKARSVSSINKPAAEVEEDTGLGVGGIVGIAIALVALLLAIVAVIEYRKRREREQVHKFAGAQADLESPPPAGDAGAGPWMVPQPDNDPGGPDADPEEDEESDAPSVWSEGDEEPSEPKMLDGNEAVESTAGSALAAMGVASTLSTRQLHDPKVV